MTRPRFKQLIATLRDHHGAPPPPPTRDPFELAVWENCAYLVDDEKRAAIYATLKKRIGLDPDALLEAPEDILLSICSPECARKLQRVARVGVALGQRALRMQCKSDPDAARKLLKKFPGFGDPGADRALLYTHGRAVLAPESNALRVLERVGFIEPDDNYARQYKKAAAALAPELPADHDELIDARELLRLHGQTLCRRTDPHCDECPVRPTCLWATLHA